MGNFRPSSTYRLTYRRYQLHLSRRLAGVIEKPLFGISKDSPPSYAEEESTPAEDIAALCFGVYGATVHPRSVFVVSHHLDGFRLSNPAHLAMGCRPWDS